MKKLAIISAYLLISIAFILQARPATADAMAGAAVFDESCADCHSADSDELREGPPLKGVKNGKLPSGAKATREAILEKINSGGGAMPEFKDRLTDEQKEDLVAYIMTL